jgi:hypothetical protein
VPSGHAPWLAPALIGSWRLLDTDADLAEQAEKDLTEKKDHQASCNGFFCTFRASARRSVLPSSSEFAK